jgi:hypothetical protein
MVEDCEMVAMVMICCVVAEGVRALIVVHGFGLNGDFSYEEQAEWDEHNWNGILRYACY